MAVDTSSPPPRRASAPRKPTAQKVEADQKRIDSRTQSVSSLFQLAQFGCVSVGAFSDAGAIAKHGLAASHELAKLAEINPWIAKGIDSLDVVGPWAGLLTALMPLGLQILANHGKIPVDRVASIGVVPPRMLEAQAKAQLAQLQQAAIEQQRQAEEDLARAQAAMNRPADREPADAVAYPPPHPHGEYPRDAYADFVPYDEQPHTAGV